MYKFDVGRAALFLLGSALLLFAVSCGGETRSVRGLIVEVVAESFLVVDTFTVEDEDQVRWTIHGGGKRFEGFPPSHLREHMVQGLPVTVWFEERDGMLFMKDIAD